jgi:hypothetical protein
MSITGHVRRTAEYAYFSYWRIGAMAGLALSSIYTKDQPGFRDIAPEPIDYFDHAGNVTYGVAAGAITAAATLVGNSIRGEENVSTVRRRAVMAAFCVGVALNTIGETKLGTSIFVNGMENEVTDFAYGVAATTAAAAATIGTGEKELPELPNAVEDNLPPLYRNEPAID